MAGISIYGAAGFVGVLLYLGSYGALQLGLLRGSALTYTLLNLLAAASILFSLLENWNLFSAMIQIFWIVISLVGIGRRIWLRSRLSFSPEDATLLAQHLPTLPPLEAHRITRLIRRERKAPGEMLALKGQPVGALIYLASGTAEVSIEGRPVARLEPGSLVGEMTVMHGGSATADVRVETEAEVMILPRDRLLAEINGSPEIGLAVGHALQSEVQRKLQRMNAGQAEADHPA